jgi:hypothetical protein
MKTLKGALIVTPTGIPTICIVRDFSETGACLEVHSPIPHNVFELVFDDSDGWPPRSSRVMWRKPSRMGVRFE